MAEEQEELTAKQKLDLATVTTDGKKVLFDACHLTVKDKHIVAECDSIEASEELALLLMEDVFIRIKPVKPAKVTEDFQFTTMEELKPKK